MTDRNFAAEIDASQGDSVKLRTIADEINACGAPRVLMIRAIQRARAAESGAHPFGQIGTSLGLPRPDGLPLYRHKLASQTFGRIEERLQADLGSELKRASLAPAFVIWAADWFRRSYKGGIQRWADIENVLGLNLPQSEWRNLADRGFSGWGIKPLITAHGNQRLANIARQGGFPAAAIAGGASWPRKFLERAVGEVLGAGSQDIESAIEICERNEYLIPSVWRSQEMQAICGELALKIAELRDFADREGLSTSRSYSSILDEIYEDWRAELPMTLDGAAASLIDTLLEARKLTGGGSIRVERILQSIDGGWRECLEFHLDGRWDDKSRIFGLEIQQRVFLQPAGSLADRISGRLAFLEHETDQYWIARPMGGSHIVEFPFAEPALADFHARGERLSPPFPLPGGEPTGEALRVFERRTAPDFAEPYLSLIGQGSGAYRLDEILLDFPNDWTIEGKNMLSKIECEDFPLATDRQLHRCSGEINVHASNGDIYLIRTGQSADRRDRLAIVGTSVVGVQAPDGGKLIQHPIHAEVEDGIARRTGAQTEIRWRYYGERLWQGDITAAGPGECEFGWIDKDTGHLRAKETAWILPAEFSLIQHQHRTSTEIVLSGWDGEARLNDDTNSGARSWKIKTDPPHRVLAALHLGSSRTPSFTLNVPIRAKEWLTTWDGKLVSENAVLGLADLRETVARVPVRSHLMGEISRFSGTSLEATWTIDSELGLSALRGDIATLMRPLGIDAKVKLNFLNGSENYWYVTEFGNELEWEPGGGVRPKNGVVGNAIRICGRYLGAAEKEIDLGNYEGTANLLGARPITLPRLRGPWLVYLREGSRILTRPKYIPGDELPDPPQHELGRSMAQPFEQARLDLIALVDRVQSAPLTPEAAKTLSAVIDLAISLNGLPPQTFEIFGKLEQAGIFGPLMLYRCEERHLTALIELFDGLPSSWTLLPRPAWDEAFQRQGQYLVGKLDDPKWALTNISERQNEIAARMPQLAPLVCRDYRAPSWKELREHFTSHTCEGINCDSDIQSPFRKDFADFLPEESFATPLLRVFDAPFAAALATCRKITLNQLQKLTVKDAERRHPNYFAMAYGYALSEIDNG